MLHFRPNTQQAYWARLQTASRSAAIAYWSSSFIHEISQPIHVVQNMSDILELHQDNGTLTSSPAKNSLAIMQVASQSASNCIADLKRQLIEWESQQQKVDLCDIVKQTLVAAEASLSPTLRIQTAYCSQSVEVTCDALQLQVVLVNLLSVCMHAFTSLRDRGAAGDAAVLPLVSLDVRLDGQHGQIEISSDSPILLPPPILSASPAELLPSSTWGSCLSIVHANGGELVQRICPVENGQDAEYVFGFVIRFPLSTRPIDDFKIRRMVRKIWDTE